MAAGLISRKIQSHTNANGLAVIFSNDYKPAEGVAGSHSLKELSGTMEDGRKMELCFESLNFTTYYDRNVSKKGMLDVVKHVAGYSHYPPSYKRIVLVFSGHGTSGQKMYTNDGKTVKVEEILAPFDPTRAPAIGNIPKLFFLDACRGESANPGAMVPKGSKLVDTLKVPQKGNVLVAYSTLPEYKSYEEKAKGGIWMTALAEKLRSKSKSVCDILTEVNKELVKKYQDQIYHGCIQQPEFVSRLNEVVNFRAEAQKSRGETVSESDESSEESAEKEGAQKEPTEPPTEKAKKKKTTRQNLKRAISSSSGKSATPPSPRNSPSPATGKRVKNGSQSDPTNRKHKPPPIRTPSADYSGIGGNAKQRLESYCTQEGKPKPQFRLEQSSNGKFKATVYVAKTFGRITGDTMSSKGDAEVDAAAKYLEKLHL